MRQLERINARIREIKEDYWERFTKEMGRDMYESQRKMWRMLKMKKLEIKDTMQTNKINAEEWVIF